MEEFKKISGYENYSISNFGNVRNDKTNRILKPGVNGGGYYHIILSKKSKLKIFKIHRLVAFAFIPNPNNKLVVDHQNNNKLDNSVENLRWSSFSENSHNAKLSLKNTSGVKGITFHKKANKWRAQIYNNGKYFYLGLFDNLEEAKKARQKKAHELFGEYMNKCEKEVIININIPKKLKNRLKININLIDDELDKLEKEFQQILNK